MTLQTSEFELDGWNLVSLSVRWMRATLTLSKLICVRHLRNLLCAHREIIWQIFPNMLNIKTQVLIGPS